MLTGQHATGRRGQQREQLELSQRHARLRAANDHLVAFDVDHHVAGLDAPCQLWMLYTELVAPQLGTDAGVEQHDVGSEVLESIER